MGSGPVGQVAEGPFTDLAVLTVALAQEDRRGEFRLGTDSIYMAEYGQTGPPCTSNKYYITWLRFRRISGTVAGDFSRLVVKGRRKLRLKKAYDFNRVRAAARLLAPQC